MKQNRKEPADNPCCLGDPAQVSSSSSVSSLGVRLQENTDTLLAWPGRCAAHEHAEVSISAPLFPYVRHKLLPSAFVTNFYLASCHSNKNPPWTCPVNFHCCFQKYSNRRLAFSPGRLLRYFTDTAVSFLINSFTVDAEEAKKMKCSKPDNS